jgi:transposase
MATLPSPLPVLLPDSARLGVKSVHHTDDAIVIVACATGGTASCPDCGVGSCHIHSQYARTLRDLPWQGAVVRMDLRTRRFYCRSPACRRKIFTERFPNLTVSYGRQTNRHREVLKRIGYALGGEAGFRLASQLAVDSSPDTILRVLKQDVCPAVAPNVRVLGVDDWAWRKGQRYGTILVDLESHQPIDLLPDRESETLEKWLKAHPEVEVISRDRAGAYAEGARLGAPAAMQVADRFPILCNLTQALRKLVERVGGVLRRAQVSEPPPPPGPSPDCVNAEPNSLETPTPVSDPVKLNRHQQQSQHRRARRKERYEAVRTAYQRGVTQRAIAQEFGLSRRTVRRFLQATEFPEQAPRRRSTGLEPYRQYLEKRWAEGCHNATRLWRELRQQGYTGQRSRVKAFLQPWRSPMPKQPPRNRKLPGLRLVAFWLSKPAAQRTTEEQQWVQAVTTEHPEVAMAERMAQAFRDLFRDRKADGLDPWLDTAQASGIPEFQGFAGGIQRDHDAVVAGIEEVWSNGQVEGQVHRLKLLKRQMYGRSGFLLLRRRVLPFKTGIESQPPRSP